MENPFKPFEYDYDPRKDIKDTSIQLVISLALGFGASFTFCILRPRWTGLYAARKKCNGEATSLPELPSTLLGWIPVVWGITEEQVLASAGLDAYVFLAFFKMAIKFLVISLFFALVVIKPIHDEFPDPGESLKKNQTHSDLDFWEPYNLKSMSDGLRKRFDVVVPFLEGYETDYLWMYLAFAYLFTGLAVYLIVSETRKIIKVRQEYLGSQTTITDRTICLSGIPPELRSKERIKTFVEELEIGKVESVMLCRNWEELDNLVVDRMSALRKLEEAWTAWSGRRRVGRSLESLPQPVPPGPIDGNCLVDENSRLLGVDDNSNCVTYTHSRPTTRIWYGYFKLKYRNVDAIDHYEERVRRLDYQITALRQQEFEPTPLAFVTMDSVASCQMAVQAVLDPSPQQLLATTSPAPSDVVWPNTYLSERRRTIKKWSIKVLILILTVFWSILLIPIAGALNLESIHKVWPALADLLESHPLTRSFIQTQLPTFIVSGLNIAVPYLYDWLSNFQGRLSQGEVELSVISKNFIFTFFNFFIVFTVFGTASNFYGWFKHIDESLRHGAWTLAAFIAKSLRDLLLFYTNFIILQGLGLYPFRLLQIGAVVLYPIQLMGSKTPRDYAELVQPQTFSYGFFLPQTILIFIICLVYSVLRSSWRVLLAGLAYFVIGHFVHKYQLLYSMDHRQHSTGRGWLLICDRVFVGIVLFQIVMGIQLALSSAIKRSLFILVLIGCTVWYSTVYHKTYRPLMNHIALKSLRRAEHSSLGNAAQSIPPSSLSTSRYEPEARSQHTVDEARESGFRFINPSLICELEDIWIEGKPRNNGTSGPHLHANGGS